MEKEFKCHIEIIALQDIVQKKIKGKLCNKFARFGCYKLIIIKKKFRLKKLMSVFG